MPLPGRRVSAAPAQASSTSRALVSAAGKTERPSTGPLGSRTKTTRSPSPRKPRQQHTTDPRTARPTAQPLSHQPETRGISRKEEAAMATDPGHPIRRSAVCLLMTLTIGLTVTAETLATTTLAQARPTCAAVSCAWCVADLGKGLLQSLDRSARIIGTEHSGRSSPGSIGPTDGPRNQSSSSAWRGRQESPAGRFATLRRLLRPFERRRPPGWSLSESVGSL